MTQEALKLALEALENGMKFVWTDPEREAGFVAIDAIKEALAQPVQEPVAWMVYTQDGQSVFVTDNPTDFTDEHRALPLYTTPPAATESLPVPEPVASACRHGVPHRWPCDSCDGGTYNPPLPEQPALPVLTPAMREELNSYLSDHWYGCADEVWRRILAANTTPQQRPWVELTDEEINACDPSEECWGLHKIARAIEAKLKEKNA